MQKEMIETGSPVGQTGHIHMTNYTAPIMKTVTFNNNEL
jgi:hypothetical protein